MKVNFKTLLGLLSLTLSTSTQIHAQETTPMTNTASYIEMTAAEKQTDALAQFLTDAAPVVKTTEPGTKLWFALKGQNQQLAIFDIFADDTARNAHFAGQVAGALKAHSDELVKGGWEQGVVENVNNSTVLSTKEPVDLYTATTATYIKLKAAPGQGDSLSELLTAAGAIVTRTEPKTLYWAALRLDENHFAIFDIFADNSGREAHFAGKVAGLLKEKSAVLVDGGWDAGVVANVSHFEILAIK